MALSRVRYATDVTMTLPLTENIPDFSYGHQPILIPV
jgi:hypothetical protein